MLRHHLLWPKEIDQPLLKLADLLEIDDALLSQVWVVQSEKRAARPTPEIMARICSSSPVTIDQPRTLFSMAQEVRVEVAAVPLLTTLPLVH